MSLSRSIIISTATLLLKVPDLFLRNSLLVLFFVAREHFLIKYPLNHFNCIRISSVGMTYFYHAIMECTLPPQTPNLYWISILSSPFSFSQSMHFSLLLSSDIWERFLIKYPPNVGDLVTVWVIRVCAAKKPIVNRTMKWSRIPFCMLQIT